MTRHLTEQNCTQRISENLNTLLVTAICVSLSIDCANQMISTKLQNISTYSPANNQQKSTDCYKHQFICVELLLYVQGSVKLEFTLNLLMQVPCNITVLRQEYIFIQLCSDCNITTHVQTQTIKRIAQRNWQLDNVQLQKRYIPLPQKGFLQGHFPPSPTSFPQEIQIKFYTFLQVFLSYQTTPHLGNSNPLCWEVCQLDIF